MALALRFAEEADYNSRACHDTYDDEPELPPSKAIFRWSKPVRMQIAATKATNATIAVKRLLVATPGGPQLFLEHMTASWHLAGSLIATDQSIHPVTMQPRRSPIACQLLSRHAVEHEAFGTEMALLVPYDISSHSIWQWTQALSRHVVAEDTIVLDSQLSTLYDFGGFNADDAPMVRLLATTTARETKLEGLVPMLETPRFATGVTAALLTQGELRRRRVRALISLQSAHTQPMECANSFAPLVSLLDLPTPVPGASASLLTADQDGVDSFHGLYT